ncbi:glutamyl-tRNA reductase [Clostridium acetobutylicum]|nr:glutamyl-tRNA reductase [Clostridium acetobutylicum]
MIQLLALKRDLKVEIREKFSIIEKRIGDRDVLLKEVCNEVVILSTCNRIEIYFNSEKNRKQIIEEIFSKMGWSINFLENFFYCKGDEAINHLMEVACGFDSLILGEDQILGQIKAAYDTALKNKTSGSELKKLFQLVITCGKEFRSISMLNRIPVSSASIAVNKARQENLKRFMVFGFGDVGSLVCKYILSSDFDVLYIVVRNKAAVSIKDKRIKVLSFNEKNSYYDDVECMISCTSAPHPVIWEKELPYRKFTIFDLAVPRDVEETVYSRNNIDIYDIDQISMIDNNNRKKRKEIMVANRHIMSKYILEFYNWQKVQEIVPDIIKLKLYGESINKRRYETFKNKKATKDNDMLVNMLIKSTSNVYINRAIEVLKEEQLKGRGEDCLKLLRRIFQK